MLDYVSLENYQFFTESYVCKAISELKSKRSSGPNCIPAYVFKGYGDMFVKSMTFLFSLALSSGKKSKIISVLKFGNKNCVEQYRPISISMCF